MEDTASLKYFYDKDGTISGREVGGVKQTYKYDKIGQLLAVIDPAGKEVEKYVAPAAAGGHAGNLRISKLPFQHLIYMPFLRKNGTTLKINMNF